MCLDLTLKRFYYYSCSIFSSSLSSDLFTILTLLSFFEFCTFLPTFLFISSFSLSSDYYFAGNFCLSSSLFFFSFIYAFFSLAFSLNLSILVSLGPSSYSPFYSSEESFCFIFFTEITGAF